MLAAIPLDALAPGSSLLHRIGSAKILIARIGDAVYATSAICTHARVELAAESLTPEGLIECPMHGALFSPIDGSVQDGPATVPLQTFETRVVDGVVHIDVDDAALEAPSHLGPSTPGSRPSLASWGLPAG